MVVLIGGEKGGTGKSTIATNLAGFAAHLGEDVLLIDADAQSTVTFWSITRSDEQADKVRVPCLAKTGGQIHREVEGLRRKFGKIIIDAGGRDSVELRSSMVGADKFFMPIRPSQFDVWTLEKISRMIEHAHVLNPNLKAYAFINLASTHPKVNETAEAREYIKDFEHITLANSIVRDRIVFRNAGKAGLCVFEMDDQKAKDEIESLYREVFST